MTSGSSRLPRVVIDGRRLTATRTGVGRYLELLLSEWAATELPGSEVHVVLADPSGMASVPNAPGMTAEVAAPGMPGLLWERFGLASRLGPGDLLFAPANLVPAGWRGPMVLVMHDALQEVRPGDFSRLVRLRFGGRYRRALAKADRVIVPSRSTADDLGRIYGVSGTRIAVIPPAPDRGFRPMPPDDPAVASAPPPRPFFLFAGKRSRRRNVPAILDAFAIHRRSFPDFRLIFVGDATGAALDCPGVIDMGHVGEPVLHALFATAIALLYPSEHEGFGLPVVEAMASGCPVVTLRRAALVEVGGDGPVYLDEATPEAIAGAMAALVTNPDARAERIRVGLLAAARFTPEAFAAGVTRELRRAWADASADARRGTRR